MRFLFREPEIKSPGEGLDRSTVAVRAGRGNASPGDPLNPAPVFASAFHDDGTLGYARDGNPTWSAFEEAIGALDGGDAVTFSSGMAAVAAVLEGVGAGERIVVARSAYVEVRRLLEERRASGKLALSAVDPNETEEMLAAIPGSRLVWIDAISNPLLDVPDLRRIAEAAKAAGSTLLVDATLATPMLLRPIELGADLVLHSATKYIGGHSDLLLGVITARDRHWADRLRRARTTLGAVPGTMETFLGLRGLRTLPLRIERGQAGAALLAERLAGHPQVRAVRYPGLECDPSHAEASRLLDGFGAMLSFEATGGTARADAICSEVSVFTHATSLGGVESLIERHSRWHAEPAVPESLLRISVGCEHPEDLWRDLEGALTRTASPAPASASAVAR